MDGSELIVRGKKEWQIFELIPLHLLNVDFPAPFVHNAPTTA
jgi:hypothetical protein